MSSPNCRNILSKRLVELWLHVIFEWVSSDSDNLILFNHSKQTVLTIFLKELSERLTRKQIQLTARASHVTSSERMDGEFSIEITDACFKVNTDDCEYLRIVKYVQIVRKGTCLNPWAWFSAGHLKRFTNFLYLKTLHLLL